MTNKTVLGIRENWACALTYLFGYITGIIFLFLEKDNPKVRFHAMQSLLVFAVLSLLKFILGKVFIIGGLLSWATGVVILVAWVFLLFQALTGQDYKVPVIGAVIWDRIMA